MVCMETAAVFLCVQNWKHGIGRLSSVQDNRELGGKLATTGKNRFEWSSISEFQVGNSSIYLEL